MANSGGFWESLIGRAAELPETLVHRFPELGGARYRVGGLPPRVGGWFLGARSVAAITLWRTIWLSPDVGWEAALLLHEVRHVHQFGASAAFPVQYVWESLRRGYQANRFESDARAYASERMRGAVPSDPGSGDA